MQSHIETTLTDYKTQIESYLNQNNPNATVGDVIGERNIIKQELGILPVTLPHKIVTAGVRQSEIADSLRYKVTFEIKDSTFFGASFETSLSYSVSIPELAGKRVTLSYAPATAADEQVINNYGGIFKVPAYLVSMKPQIKIEGVVAATGNPIGLGNDQTFNMQFVSPAYGTDIVSNIILAGAYYGVGITPGRISQELLAQRKAKLESVKDTICIANPNSDDCGGEILFSTAMGYFYLSDGFEDVTAQSISVIKMKDVSEAIVSDGVKVSTLFGMPRSVAESGVMIDIDRNNYVALSKNGDATKVLQFMITTGQMGSALEHGIFELMYQAKGVSTVQFLQLANSQGIPIYTITQTNISTVLPILQISNEVKTDIQNAVNAGRTVVVPQQNITYSTITGTGYIVLDTQTGVAAYMISTNLAGGGQCIDADGVVNHCLLTLVDIWHYLDTFAAIIAVPNIAAFALYLTITEYSIAEVMAVLALSVGLTLLTIIIAAIIVFIVIAIIHFIIIMSTAAVEMNRNLYAIKRRITWTS